MALLQPALREVSKEKEAAAPLGIVVVVSYIGSALAKLRPFRASRQLVIQVSPQVTRPPGTSLTFTMVQNLGSPHFKTVGPLGPNAPGGL